MFSDNFLGTAVPPQNWMQFSGGANDIAHDSPGHVRLTDSTGNTTGILSTQLNLDSPVGTKINAQINRVSLTPSLGNAIVGLVGVDQNQNQTGSLAAGIDAQGNVFLVWSQAQGDIKQANLVIGTDSSYSGGATELTFKIEQDFVQVLTPQFTSKEVPYSQLNTNFSLAAAFKDGAIPALAGASQPGATGGAASFESINIPTAAKSPRRRSAAP